MYIVNCVAMVYDAVFQEGFTSLDIALFQMFDIVSVQDVLLCIVPIVLGFVPCDWFQCLSLDVLGYVIHDICPRLCYTWRTIILLVD